MRKEASLDKWAELYEVTMNIRKLQPWNFLWDLDVITIILPEYDEPFYCSIMGRAGECLAIAVYKGFEAINGFYELSGSNEMPYDQLIRYQDNLTCFFGDRDELSKEELKIIKELGYKFRGRNQWLYFRSFKPGYYPYILDNDEVIELTYVFKNLFMSLRAIIEKKMKINFEDGNTLYRTYDKDKDLWLNFDGPIQIPNRQRKIPIITDDLLMERIKRKKYLYNPVEFDTVFLNTCIDDKKYERPILPRVIVFAEGNTGLLLQQEMMLPETDSIQQILDFFVRFLVDSGKPKTLYVRDEYIADLLSDVCNKVKIKLIISKKLPSIDEFADSFGRRCQ